MPSSAAHKDHRKRLRKRFINEGLDSFDNHVILELLLTFSIPLKDTNETAHALLDYYKSISAVFDADFEDLLAREGIGEQSAVLLKLIPSLFRVYSLDKAVSRPNFNDIDKLGEYLVSYFIGCTRERATVILLDNSMSMIDCINIHDGTVNEGTINVRKIAEIGFSRNASSFVLAHCHPDGDVTPSREDINTSNVLKRTFDILGMPMVEHIIVAGNRYLPLLKTMRDSSAGDRYDF